MEEGSVIFLGKDNVCSLQSLCLSQLGCALCALQLAEFVCLLLSKSILFQHSHSALIVCVLVMVPCILVVQGFIHSFCLVCSLLFWGFLWPHCHVVESWFIGAWYIHYYFILFTEQMQTL